MLGLKNESSITLSGEQIESMDSFDLESVIEEVGVLKCYLVASSFRSYYQTFQKQILFNLN